MGQRRTTRELPPATVQAILRRLALGLPKRAIARELGVARSTIYLLLDRGAARRYPRCGECGALVVETPCRQCHAETIHARAKLRVP